MGKHKGCTVYRERGDIPLDKSLALFEEGAGLVKKCSAMLDGAEKQLRILTTGENGEVTEKAFEVEE